MATKLYVEASEIMAAVAMTLSKEKLKSYESRDGLVKFLIDGKKIANSNKILYGKPADKKEFLKAFDPSEKQFLDEAAKGISAAYSIKEWLVEINDRGVNIKKPIADRVFMTGDTWPTEVQKFQVEAFGFKSYNSSDIIFRVEKGYYGVSLKKKAKETAPDPTIINKAFDSVLQGNEFNKIKNDIKSVRAKYFSKVIREAFKKGPLKLVGKLPTSDEELFSLSIKDIVKGGKRAIIDLKGYGVVNLNDQNKSSKTLFPTDITKDIKLSMREFVNRKLGSNDSVFSELIKVLNKYSEIFANSLLNLVLKTNLYKELEDNSFAFALITAVAKLDKDDSPQIQVSQAKPLHTVLCGLSALNKGRKKYEIKLDKEKNKNLDAAKVYLLLSKGNVNVLDMELRYKGSFTPQPQFFATISKDFSKIINEQCIVPA
jgi:hypothetical protein